MLQGGWYSNVVCLGTDDDLPMLTMTYVPCKIPVYLYCYFVQFEYHSSLIY